MPELRRIPTFPEGCGGFARRKRIFGEVSHAVADRLWITSCSWAGKREDVEAFVLVGTLSVVASRFDSWHRGRGVAAAVAPLLGPLHRHGLVPRRIEVCRGAVQRARHRLVGVGCGMRQ